MCFSLEPTSVCAARRAPMYSSVGLYTPAESWRQPGLAAPQFVALVRCSTIFGAFYNYVRGFGLPAAASVPISARSPVTVPWYVWCSVAAGAGALTGVDLGISWHRSRGRHSLWTAAHSAI